MTSAADQAAAVFKADGTMWQERPVKPPPYVPTVEQIDATFADLLGRVIAGKVSDGSNQHALFRQLRVIRLTKTTEPDQRFSLQVQTAGAGPMPEFVQCAIVDVDGKPAEWTPPPPPPPETKAELRAMVADLQSQLARVSALVETREDGEK